MVDCNLVVERSRNHYLGNTENLNLPKTVFLCSRKVPASVELKCYDWANKQREKGNCVISGFHSQIEKDVLYYLLKGRQLIILVLARGLKEKVEPEFGKPIEQGRLLVISPFEKSVKRAIEKTALIRNELMIDLADKIAIGFASQRGKIEKLIKSVDNPIDRIDLSISLS